MYNHQCSALVEAFEEIMVGLNVLGIHIYEDLQDCPLWIYEITADWTNDRDKAIYALKQFEPMLSEPKGTWSCPGVIGGTFRTFELIDIVNQAKDKFRTLVRAYQQEQQQDRRFVHSLLMQAGYGLINLKQVYRHIQYVKYHPKKFAWTKAKNSVGKILDIAQAREALLKMGEGENIKIQLSKLDLLPPNALLFQRHEIKPCWYVNVTAREESKFVNPVQKIQTSIPIFYLHDFNMSTPMVYVSKRDSNKKRLIRDDKMVEEEPFLKAIHAYRYRNASIQPTPKERGRVSPRSRNG